MNFIKKTTISLLEFLCPISRLTVNTRQHELITGQHANLWSKIVNLILVLIKHHFIIKHHAPSFLLSLYTSPSAPRRWHGNCSSTSVLFSLYWHLFVSSLVNNKLIKSNRIIPVWTGTFYGRRYITVFPRKCAIEKKN